MTYFNASDVAERYAAYRPYVHPQIVDHIAAITGPVGRALDVGCGTGQSTMALLGMADEVAGIDISAAMLAQRQHDPRLSFAIAPAESLPFDDGCFGLVTTGLAFHWFDQPAFLGEAYRVLALGGWLAVYNNAFTGVMIEDAAYLSWHHAQYLAHYPGPPRNLGSGDESQWARAGFVSHAQEAFDQDVTLTLDQWAGYLSTQSNVIAQIAAEKGTADSVIASLKENGAPFFRDASRTFRFHSVLDIYQARPAE